MIHPTPADIGRKVIYRDPYGPTEYGRISSVNELEDGTYEVWVRYGMSSTGQLTPVDRLSWDS